MWRRASASQTNFKRSPTPDAGQKSASQTRSKETEQPPILTGRTPVYCKHHNCDSAANRPLQIRLQIRHHSVCSSFSQSCAHCIMPNGIEWNQIVAELQLWHMHYRAELAAWLLTKISRCKHKCMDVTTKRQDWTLSFLRYAHQSNVWNTTTRLRSWSTETFGWSSLKERSHTPWRS